MKTLLHICCAPCSITCIEELRGEGIEPVGYWNNPNIHPYTEWRMRRNTLVDYAKSIGLELIVDGEYGLRPFVQAVAGDIDHRCGYCYESRLRPTAEYAAAPQRLLGNKTVMYRQSDHSVLKRPSPVSAPASDRAFITSST